MKKLLGILIVGLLLGNNAHANETRIYCSYIAGKTYYDTKVDTFLRNQMFNNGLPILDKIFLVNVKTKTIHQQQKSGKFVLLGEGKNNFDIIWSIQSVKWSYNFSTSEDLLYKINLNRPSGILVEELMYGEKNDIRKNLGLIKSSSTYICEVSEPIF